MDTITLLKAMPFAIVGAAVVALCFRREEPPQPVQELTLEDIEDPNGEFCISEGPDFLGGAELERWKRKYRVVKVTYTGGSQSCGDDGICRTGPGASFWYD